MNPPSEKIFVSKPSYRVWMITSGLFIHCITASAQINTHDDTLSSPETPVNFEELETAPIIPASSRDIGVGFHWSLIKFPKFRPTPTTTYKDIYGKAGPYLAVSNDYFLLQGGAGALTAGWHLGVSFDHGKFGGITASFMALPMMLDLTYRGEFIARQLWIPFIRGGLGGTFFRQKSQDPGFTRSGQVAMISAGFGLDLLLDFFLWDYSKFMDTHFGINWTTINGEFKWVQSPGQDDNSLSHWRIDIGVRFEL